MADVAHKFAVALEGAEVGLFFYAGHGLQVAGENYLIPVDAALEHEADLEWQSVRVSRIQEQLEREERTNIIILDACRDNPFAKQLARRARNIGLGSGLAPMERGIGTLIAFATQPDNVALDGEGEHSPFTTALLRHIEEPGLEVRRLMTRVRADVYRATDHQQTPWDRSSLLGDFYFVPPAVPEEDAAVPEAKVAALSPPEPEPPLADTGSAGRILEVAPPPAATGDTEDETETKQPSPLELAELALKLGPVERRRVQEDLMVLGHATGGVDGVFGPRTRTAIGTFQRAAKLPSTGYLDEATLRALSERAQAAIEAKEQEAAAAPEVAPLAPVRPPAELRPSSIVQCRGPNDPPWVEFRLVTLQQCRELGGSWAVP
jgi:hypothetical protein